MNSKDMELSNSVVSFGQARKLKSIISITSALSLFLFIILPFYVTSDGVLYGFKTFQLISGLEIFSSVGNSGYDLRWLVYLFQFYLLLDVVFSLISFRVFDLKVFYLTSLTRHTTKLFLSVALLVGCCLDQGKFVLNSLLLIILITIGELIFDAVVMRKKVYNRYRYDYPYRFMFFTSAIIAIFTLLPLIKAKSLLGMLLPTGDVDQTQLIIASAGSVVFVAIFITLMISVLFGIVFRSYVNKLGSGFDIWRSIAIVIFFGIILPIVELSGSPEFTYLCFRIASLMSLVQLVFTIVTAITSKKAIRIYEVSVKDNPWIAKYEENSWYNVSVLPVSLALLSLALCFISVYNIADGYSLYDVIVSATAKDLLTQVGHGSAVEMFAFLTLLLCFSNFIISIITMFVKSNKLFEMIRFGSIFVISLVTYIVIATSSNSVNHWVLIAMFIVNVVMVCIHLFKMFVLDKKSTTAVQTN